MYLFSFKVLEETSMPRFNWTTLIDLRKARYNPSFFSITKNVYGNEGYYPNFLLNKIGIIFKENWDEIWFYHHPRRQRA